MINNFEKLVYELELNIVLTEFNFSEEDLRDLYNIISRKNHEDENENRLQN